MRISEPPSSFRSNSAEQSTLLPGPFAVFILMGKTGCGKSSFIKLLGGKDPKTGEEPVVDDSINSCTSKSTTYITAMSGKPVILVDTPGFDDSALENIEPLRDIVSLLHGLALRPDKFQIHGVIFLHDISEVKLGSSQRKTLSILKYICGDACLGNVIIGTTMWDSVGSAKFKKQEIREGSIGKEHWVGMFKTTRLYEEDEKAAGQIVKDLLEKPPVILLVQQEILRPPSTIEETTVGRIVMPNIVEELLQLRRELAELKKIRTEETSQDSTNRKAMIMSIKEKIGAGEKGKEEYKKQSKPEDYYEWFKNLPFFWRILWRVILYLIGAGKFGL